MTETKAEAARPLRLIHTSDWHLGHELHGHGREHEHDSFLAWLIDRLDAEAADALVISGDLRVCT